ncbi:MAG: Do family serine endopeptidase [Pseudomonadales bacterium]|nr:Do family serine endopeptidase [Pseudomonadales bacterium]
MSRSLYRTERFYMLWSRFTAVLLLGLVSVASLEAAELPDFVSLVERNGPAIVNISTVQSVSGRSGRNSDLEELLRQLSPEDRSQLNIEEAPQRQRGGVGSGFIISEDGYIITNHHVVFNADTITVTLNDRREFIAEVIGTDELSDMALLKIDAVALPKVEFGDSELLKVGEWVLAIGSPFGLEFSAAAGIVSAKGRTVPGNATNYVAFIQTDVAINQGNSGGPLFNLDGKVIGINSQILSSTGGSNGISFAIPSNVALNVIEQLRESGSVSRGLLGVVIKDVNHALAEAFRLPKPIGAFVDEVQAGSAAEQAGVRNNDIIVEFNGREIETSAQLPYYVGQIRPGERTSLGIIRDGRALELEVVVGSLPGTDLAASGAAVRPPRDNSVGVVVSELAQSDVAALSITGVLVEQVRQGPARRAGLIAGDIIIMLDRQPVSNVEQFNDIVNGLPEKAYVPIRIMRQDGAGQMRGTTLVLELK